MISAEEVNSAEETETEEEQEEKRSLRSRRPKPQTTKYVCECGSKLRSTRDYNRHLLTQKHKKNAAKKKDDA